MDFRVGQELAAEARSLEDGQGARQAVVGSGRSGCEAALGSRQGRRPKYLRKADGEFEARLVAGANRSPP